MKTILERILFDTVLLDEDAVLLSVNKNLSLMNVIWKKQLPVGEKSAYLDEFAVVSQRHHLLYLLSDARALPFLNIEEQNLIVAALIRHKGVSKIERIARVGGKQSYELMDVFSLKEKIQKTFPPDYKVELEDFEDPESALFWLLDERRHRK